MDEVAQRGVVALAHPRMRQQLVDDRGRKEELRHPVTADGVDDRRRVRRTEDDVAAAVAAGAERDGKRPNADVY